MSTTQYRGIFAGVVLGSISLFLTYHVPILITMDSNLMLRVLSWAAAALVVPGMFVELVTGAVYRFPWWTIAAMNFLFWFGFGWLFGIFVDKLLKLRQAIAAAGAGVRVK